MQAVLTVEQLPDGAVEAAADFYQNQIAKVEQLVEQGAKAITIVLPFAKRDHDDWRRALARDLGRKHAPVRVNVVGAGNPQATAGLVEYLEGASGATGQYCPAHG